MIKSYFRRDKQGVAISHIPPPQILRGFPNAVRVKPKTGYAYGLKRARWKDVNDGTIYEWDYQHGRVEAYDKRGKHLGEFDAATGSQLAPAIATRGIQP